MSAHVLITGATGLIGFKVLQAILKDGHSVRYTVRSEDKAKTITSNPVIQKLSPGNKLSSVIIPDMAAEGAFDTALEGITHILHVGSPVPDPRNEPMTQIFLPTIKGSHNLLKAAMKSQTVKRIIITSSAIVNIKMPIPDPTITYTSSSREPIPGLGTTPSSFENGFEAYTMAKLHEIYNTEQFMKTHTTPFSISYIMPGYIWGRNDLILDPESALTANSSNMAILRGITGQGWIAPVLGGYAHIDDVADLHLKLMHYNPPTSDNSVMTNFGIASKCSMDEIFPIVEKHFPKAVAEGTFKEGSLETLPVTYDCSETRELLGTGFRSLESAIVDIAGQYLELLGKERA